MLLLDHDGEVTTFTFVRRVIEREATRHAPQRLIAELAQPRQDVLTRRYAGRPTELHGFLEHQSGDPGIH